MIRDLAAGGAPDLSAAYDVCIVGAGPAGITVARKLGAAGRRVLLLEGGGTEIDADSQEIYDGDILGRDYASLDTARLRFLGGTSNHWGGRCRLLDPFDFEAREDVPHTGWPIGIDALSPHLAEACEICGIADFDEPRRPIEGTAALEHIPFRWSSNGGPFSHAFGAPARLWGEYYREELADSDRIDVLLNATATDLALDEAAGRVDGVVFRSWSGDPLTARAGQVVLAMGGLENCRFMLNLNAAHGGRMGDQGGMVGRFFMEHPHIAVGEYFGTERLRLWSFEPDLALDSVHSRQKPEVIVGPTPDFMRRERIMNCGLRIDAGRRRPLTPEQTAGAPFVEGLRYDEDYFFTDKLFAAAEQAPNPASRVRLVEDRDRFGQRRIGLDWRTQPIDRRTIEAVTLEVARMMIRSGIGRVRLADWLLSGDEPDYFWGHHHMGGLRMSAGPETGVVDADGRVHGVPNLYVAGSAVFPTGGHANPTLTIVQLALRLADHLA